MRKQKIFAKRYWLSDGLSENEFTLYLQVLSSNKKKNKYCYKIQHRDAYNIKILELGVTSTLG